MRHKSTYILHKMFGGQLQRDSVNALELLLGWIQRQNLIISVHKCNYTHFSIPSGIRLFCNTYHSFTFTESGFDNDSPMGKETY